MGFKQSSKESGTVFVHSLSKFYSDLEVTLPNEINNTKTISNYHRQNLKEFDFPILMNSKTW